MSNKIKNNYAFFIDSNILNKPNSNIDSWNKYDTLNIS